MTGRALQKAIDEIVKKYHSTNLWSHYSGEKLTKHGAQTYVKQHGVFTRHSRMCWAAVVSNCPEVEVRRFVVKENLFEEEGDDQNSHFMWIVKLGQALGLQASEIHDAQALPSTRAAMLMWEILTHSRHWLIGCAAKATLEQVNQPYCGRFSLTEGNRWKDKLGLSEEQLHFWLAHDELDQVHGSGAFDLVHKYLPMAKGIDSTDILQAIEDSSVAWTIFLNGIAEAAQTNPAAGVGA